MMSGRLAKRERERERERERKKERERQRYLLYFNGVVAVCSVSVPYVIIGWFAVCDYNIF